MLLCLSVCNTEKKTILLLSYNVKYAPNAVYKDHFVKDVIVIIFLVMMTVLEYRVGSSDSMQKTKQEVPIIDALPWNLLVLHVNEIL